MPPRPLLLVAPSALLVLVLVLVAGCGSHAADRQPGDQVTEDEADALAGLLYRNYRAGGAVFVVTAPYAEGTVLTLTGEVDFPREIGTARAVTSFGDGRPDEARTLFFSTTEIWFGDPGCPTRWPRPDCPRPVT